MPGTRNVWDAQKTLRGGDCKLMTNMMFFCFFKVLPASSPSIFLFFYFATPLSTCDFACAPLRCLFQASRDLFASWVAGSCFCLVLTR